ncbi:MAG: MBL fold metallo-hydrolase [Actinomycetales bacterium]
MRATLIGGPTLLLEIDGFRILTDPTFDEPGEYPIGTRTLTKTQPPALTREQVGGVDLVLLSHDQHPDNLDRSGRELLGEVPVVVTTREAADRLAQPHVLGLAPWESTVVERDDASAVEVLAVPALHGPQGADAIVGPVNGFVLRGDDFPTVYVSGDNASLDHVRSIRDKVGAPDLAVLFAGGAKTPVMDAHLTVTSAEAAEAAGILESGRVVVVHTDGWGHFTQPGSTVRPAFESAGVADRLVTLTAGETADLA